MRPVELFLIIKSALWISHIALTIASPKPRPSSFILFIWYKGLIISGGFNIYPKEIEDLINDYEEVIESAVIGKNDTDLGEVPVAIIVVGNKLREKIITELNKRFIKNLAKYKIPKEIKIINELPRNAMGKIQKNKIFDLIS